MSTRKSYWILGIFVGWFLHRFLTEIRGPMPNWCGDSDNWLFLTGFFSMVVLGEVVVLVKKLSRHKIPSPIEEPSR